MSAKKNKRKTGPKPERVKIDDDWEDAMKKALKKKKPRNGWPKDEESKSKKD